MMWHGLVFARYPHHFQTRAPDGSWLFKESELRGNIEQEMSLVLDTLKKQLAL